jgi:hypothetical protein
MIPFKLIGSRSDTRRIFLRNISERAGEGQPTPSLSSLTKRRRSDQAECRRQFFLLFGLWPAGVLPDENGEGAAPPFLMFLSAFGFFFSLLLRI